MVPRSADLGTIDGGVLTWGEAGQGVSVLDRLSSRPVLADLGHGGPGPCDVLVRTQQPPEHVGAAAGRLGTAGVDGEFADPAGLINRAQLFQDRHGGADSVSDSSFRCVAQDAWQELTVVEQKPRQSCDRAADGVGVVVRDGVDGPCPGVGGIFTAVERGQQLTEPRLGDRGELGVSGSRRALEGGKCRIGVAPHPQETAESVGGPRENGRLRPGTRVPQRGDGLFHTPRPME